MLDFVNWCEENGKVLPLAENGVRTGIRGTYPDGYKRSQYPDGYFPAYSATAFLDLKNAKGTRTVKDRVNSGL